MDNFKILSKIFKDTFPEYKISIRRVKMGEGNPGDCDYLGKNKFRIRINNTVELDEQLLWLLHEVAHVLSWHSKGKDDHNADFGKAYAKCYRIYLEKFIGEDDEKK